MEHSQTGATFWRSTTISMRDAQAAAGAPARSSVRLGSAKLYPRLRGALSGLWRRPSTLSKPSSRDASAQPSTPSPPSRPDAKSGPPGERQALLRWSSATMSPVSDREARRRRHVSTASGILLPASPRPPSAAAAAARPLPPAPGPAPSCPLPDRPCTSPGTLLLQSLSDSLPLAPGAAQLARTGRSPAPARHACPATPAMPPRHGSVRRTQRRARSQWGRPLDPTPILDIDEGLGLAFSLGDGEDDKQASLHSALSNLSSSPPDPSVAVSSSFQSALTLRAHSGGIRSPSVMTTTKPPTQHRLTPIQSHGTATTSGLDTTSAHPGDELTPACRVAVSSPDHVGCRRSDATDEVDEEVHSLKQPQRASTAAAQHLPQAPATEAHSPPRSASRQLSGSHGQSPRPAHDVTRNFSHPLRRFPARPTWLSADELFMSSAVVSEGAGHPTSSAWSPETSAQPTPLQQDLAPKRWSRLWRRTSLSGRLASSESIRTAKKSLDTVLQGRPLLQPWKAKPASPPPRRPAVSNPGPGQHSWRARRARHTLDGAANRESAMRSRQRPRRAAQTQESLEETDRLSPLSPLGRASVSWVPPDPFAPPPEGARLLRGSPSRFYSSSPATQVQSLLPVIASDPHAYGGKDRRTYPTPPTKEKPSLSLVSQPQSTSSMGIWESKRMEGVPFPLRAARGEKWPYTT